MQSFFSLLTPADHLGTSKRAAAFAAIALSLSACGSNTETTDTAETESETPTIEESSVATNDAYKAENDAYLTANAEKDGWSMGEEGLQYFVEEAGAGDAPQAKIGDYVKVNYQLSLIDGTTVDSSFDRGEPAIFPLTERLIPGWRIGIPLMREGATYKFVMPASLGYGDRDLPDLPAHSTLLFTVNLIDVMTEEEGIAAMNAQRQAMIDAMIADQQAYLDENAKKDGVTVLESGLQYEVLESGPEGGANPGPETDVEVHYRGTLIDGSEFDSSYSRGQTATFKPTQVIRGWTEALQLMRPGDKWKLTIPHDLGYGERGSGRNIPPFATLVFEVEIVSIPGAE